MLSPILRVAFTIAGITGAAAVVFAIEIAIAMHGPVEPVFVNPSHDPVHYGASGTPLNYVVIGDSTGAGRGAPYSDGIAVRTAEYLGAKGYRVTMTNLSVSGAIAADVVDSQLPLAMRIKPDIVLLAVGANDATHFTPSSALKSQLQKIIDGLKQANSSVGIVVTGCPQLGSVPRFLQPLRWFASTQTARINLVFTTLATTRNVYWARIAQGTGSVFEHDPTLFAPDKFHPNSRGYATWLPILNASLSEALERHKT